MTQQNLLQGEFNPAVPTRIVFGNGKIDSLRDEVQKLGGKRVLVLSGRTVAEKTDADRRINDGLGDMSAGVYSGLTQRAPLSTAVEAANLALASNLVFIVALLSMLQATLTLPGIAGIVLTVGMAVDANVLIFERIREELRNGNSPQNSINVGYGKAFSTIADANITTLIAAIVLFGFGTGSIKGFAVTLSLGIITSMFTAIMGTRAVVNLIYGRQHKPKLSI